MHRPIPFSHTYYFLVLPLLLISLANCASNVPSQDITAAPAVGVQKTSEAEPQANVSAEVTRLRDALQREVPHSNRSEMARDKAWIDRASGLLAALHVVVQRPQLIVVVDRNPAVQQLRIVLAQRAAPWEVVGGSKVSTGQARRRGYFITPVGVFMHTDAILDYRALGTFNENHIRGLGLKGMRVWDFGWQTAEKGWTADAETAAIRLEMHATDPDYLEQRLGRPASEGCIRIPATMNRFLDIHGVLDADYEQAARDDRRFLGVLPPDREPTPLAGDMLIVIDSSK